MNGDKQNNDEMKIDVNELYKEETFTDRRVGMVRRLLPVRPDGSPDGSRAPRWTCR